MKDLVAGCPAERTLQMVGGRWKIFILHQLFDGTLRFSDLQRSINGVTTSPVTPKMLTQELRQMEEDGLVHREVYAQVPPKVEYSLTPIGLSLRPVVDWGARHQRETTGAAGACAAAETH